MSLSKKHQLKILIENIQNFITCQIIFEHGFSIMLTKYQYKSSAAFTLAGRSSWMCISIKNFLRDNLEVCTSDIHDSLIIMQ